MSLLNPIKLNIAQKLKDRKYRHAFFKGRSQDEIASAIFNLRDMRGMNQTQFADACQMKQSAISRLENPSYAKWNFHTLWRIAEALDARWRIVLEPMQDAIKQYEAAYPEEDAGQQAVQNFSHGAADGIEASVDLKALQTLERQVVVNGARTHDGP